MHDSSANGKTGEAWTKAQVAKADAVAVEAEAKAKSAVAKADAEARVAVAEALEADLKILKLRKEIDVFTGESEVKEYLCVSVCTPVSLSVAHCLFF